MAWKIFRKKPIEKINLLDSKLSRCLNVFDLVALGTGCTLGVGVYVISGAMSRYTTGPAACLSFLFAAITSAIAALCYAEFAARVPRSGSAYAYSYVTVGEFIAFIIGWDMVLEYVIGTSSVAKGLSNYIDSLCGNVFSNYFRALFPINVPHMAPYPDFIAFLLIVFVIILLSIGVRKSATFGNTCVAINIFTIITVVGFGLTKINPGNWFIPAENIPEQYKEDAGAGGFLPFGFAGVMAGAAQSFFAFVGFDAIAAAGEEAKNPKKDISIALIACTIICTVVYFSISTVITMLVPYYQQDIDAPFVYAFESVGMPMIKYIVGGGAICSLSSTMLNSLYPMPRIIYSMADDGVFFKKFATIHKTFKTPVYATVLVGLFAALMASLINFQELMEMLSIGTLIAYAMVAICILVLRYEYPEDPKGDKNDDKNISFRSQFFNSQKAEKPTRLSQSVMRWNTFCFIILAILSCVFIVYFNHFISIVFPYHLALFILMIVIIFINMYSISCQPIREVDIYFKTPLVPLFPCLCVFCNIYLILTLAVITWIRYAIWLVIGLVIYFSYGIRNSKEAQPEVLDMEMGNTAAVQPQAEAQS